MRNTIYRFFLGSAALSLPAFCLVLVVFITNETLRLKVEERRDEINQGLALGPIRDRLVASLQIIAARDNHGEHWNNDVWSYDPVAMAWKQFYAPDPPSSYVYRDGAKTTLNGHP